MASTGKKTPVWGDMLVRPSPTACVNYSVTELEMTGLLVNMGLWKTLQERHEFDAAVDHLAVVHILKAKTETAIPRIMRVTGQVVIL